MTRDGERHGAATRESARFSGLRYAPASKAGGFPDAWGSGESRPGSRNRGRGNGYTSPRRIARAISTNQGPTHGISDTAQKDLPASHRAGSTSEPAGRTSRLRRPREQRKPSHTRTHEARDRVACPRRRDRRPTVPLSSQGRCGGRGASLEPGAAHLQVHGGPRRAAGPDAEPPMSARPVKSPRFGRAVRPVARGAAGRMKGTLVCALRRNESGKHDVIASKNFSVLATNPNARRGSWWPSGTMNGPFVETTSRRLDSYDIKPAGKRRWLRNNDFRRFCNVILDN